MKIRSITYFCNPKYPLDEAVLRGAGEFLANAREVYETAGYDVQSTRLATRAFPKLLLPDASLPEYAQKLEGAIQQAGIAYASLGPALPESARSYAAIPEALAATRNVFFGGIMADTRRGIDVAAVRACARLIADAAPLEPNGFANLRFAALANVGPGSPFFPAAYHEADGPAFAIATEAADLAVEAFGAAKTVDEARNALIAEIERHGAAISTTAARDLRGTVFGGIDFSLAPFPEESRSLGTAFERLGVPTIGLHGSLAAAAIITESIDRADFPRAGFRGLMMPVLEDATLARRAAEGTLSVKDVLLYSAVCGTGLDTIPLPGDTTADHLVPLLLDLCALALRLDKPLTARLMPVPGKQAGEETQFDFGFFQNSRVMRLEAGPLTGALAGDQVFALRKR
ncbi:MAG TPA: DUF711 family protein [Anaerolineales bacterium]|nr:DUF711 family protein [Anaerolineales bacterium]